ncbi:MAG TPA: TolC family protein [Anaeromyxobacteraceae bacterium]|nr:TolC family protein [Anaeromyxobacteraceae bacterium]
MARSLPALAASLALAAAPCTARAAEPRTLTLEDALLELEARSLTLEQARSRVEQAAGVSRQALAPSLPTLTAAGNYTRNSDAALFSRPSAITGGAAETVVIQPQQVFGVSGALRVPLIVPSAWLEAAAARSAERGASASADAVRLQLRAALRQAAFGGTGAEEVVAATERAVDSAEEQARSAERAVAAGTGVPLAVLQARTEAVRRRSDLARARADLERARLASGVLLGRAEPVRIPAALEPGAPAPDARALLEEAQGRRPELRAATEQIAAAERQLTAARLRWLPQLSASGAVFAQTEPLPTGQEDGWRVTVDATWPIFEGGAREGRSHQAEAAAREARAAAEAERVAVAQEVEDAVRDVDVAGERLRLAEDQVTLAGEAAATARRGFAGGVSSSLDVLDANDRLYQAEVGLADSRARLGAALAALDRAVGR